MRRRAPQESLNPYIAMTDVMINLVLIFTFFLAASTVVGRAGWELVRYRDAQAKFREALERGSDPASRPTEHKGKNDPPGAQRWVFPQRVLFEKSSAVLLPEGRNAVLVFARVLSQDRFRQLWRRIRIEGHTMPAPAVPSFSVPWGGRRRVYVGAPMPLPASGNEDDWELSAGRAAQVARVFTGAGHIESYYIAIAGRAGQDPIDNSVEGASANERVEIVIEYAQQPATNGVAPH